MSSEKLASEVENKVLFQKEWGGVVSCVKDKDWKCGDKLVWSDAQPVNKQDLKEIEQNEMGVG